MNSQISKDGKLFWCSNTWFGFNIGAEDTFTNWEYLGYTFSLKTVIALFQWLEPSIHGSSTKM